MPHHTCGGKPASGGYSVIDKEGNYKESKVYGPYDPKEGKKDVGHVERQFMSDAEGPLKTDMADDKKFGDDVLALVEIHQWFTPCSGGKGCTTFLDQKVQELNGEYNEVRVSGRLSAEYLYSQLSETHPKKAKKEFITDIDDDTDYMELDDELSKKKSMIMHNNPGEFG
ncbi:hypothetical protein L7E55_10675 [Pelotomaculum isophthalicicum JI]|uniref:Uncharacterized protein n=1 Tax=Pelotomaculum isophthalicicum JI TaxID=947010 RepID=A0A9X4GZH8_9FIRM|nr:hypothetical protein [Pelotomaculum isophthalicicum]MDF9408812.1 hypothetical protein [Pelotomaculum isophthalicicum JI]